jgi:hypothetical protein
MKDYGDDIRGLDPARDLEYSHRDGHAMIQRIVSCNSERRIWHRSLTPKVMVPAAVAAVLVSAGSVVMSDAASNRPPANANAIPARLPEAAGLSTSTPGWTLVSSGTSPIWLGKGTSPVSSDALGLTGGLVQSWVTSATAQQYGTGANLPLPVPLSFAQANPGPIEATVRVLSFSSQSSASQLLDNPQFSQIGLGLPGESEVTGGGINGGTVVSIDSAANGGLSEYQFHWASGSDWYQVSVAGASMTLQQAQAFAEQVG